MSISSWMRSVRSGTMSSRSSVSVSLGGISGMAMGPGPGGLRVGLPAGGARAASARARGPLALDRHSHEVPPLGPAAIIVADLGIAQEVGENEPGVAAALADAAVDDDIVLGRQLRLALVDGAQ